MTEYSVYMLLFSFRFLSSARNPWWILFLYDGGLFLSALNKACKLFIIKYLQFIEYSIYIFNIYATLSFYFCIFRKKLMINYFTMEDCGCYRIWIKLVSCIYYFHVWIYVRLRISYKTYLRLIWGLYNYCIRNIHKKTKA